MFECCKLKIEWRRRRRRRCRHDDDKEGSWSEINHAVSCGSKFIVKLMHWFLFCVWIIQMFKFVRFFLRILFQWKQKKRKLQQSVYFNSGINYHKIRLLLNSKKNNNNINRKTVSVWIYWLQFAKNKSEWNSLMGIFAPVYIVAVRCCL